MARPPKAPSTPLPDRIARARREGRTQQALELARQLRKQSPSPEQDELLRQVLLERGTQLQERGYLRDAAVVYRNAADLGGTAEFRAVLAERLAACGDAAQAQRIASDTTDPKVRQRVLAQLADAALRQGAAGKATLPPDLHAGFDAIVQAFAASEAGRDDEARAALQTIGLTSPFLEWKLLLRGLLAYYVRDDARALENWQRLDPHHVPARLAAPLRSAIDPGFRQAQPPATQQALQQQAARLAAVAGPLGLLNELRPALANGHSLASAFRKAETLLPQLQRDYPQLAPRLAQCFFWTIVMHGQPEDLGRYHRVFHAWATPVDLARLAALAPDRRGLSFEAHPAWQLVAGELAKGPAEWPGEVGKRAQALVWEHMANNAAEFEVAQAAADGFGFFGATPKPMPLEPGPVACYERSIALAPERRDAYFALFEYHRMHKHTAKARKIGDQLLKRFPDDAATSEAMGDLALETQNAAKARAYFEKALKANPLEQRVRRKLARARQYRGLELTITNDFDAARAEYEAALAYNTLAPTPLLCQWAVLEMKAGLADQAAALIARAEQAPDQRLAVRYALVGESVRAALSPAERKRITADLTAALAQPPAPAEVLALLEAAADQRRRGLDAFRGQKTHERTFLRFLNKVPLKQFDEAQTEKLCSYLSAMEARGPWQKCLTKAERRFPNNPAFPLGQIDYHCSGGDRDGIIYILGPILNRARSIIQQLPREARERWLPALRQREAVVEALTGPIRNPLEMLGGMFNAFGDLDEFEDDEEGDW